MRLIQRKSSDWFNYPIPCISDTFKNAENFKIGSYYHKITAKYRSCGKSAMLGNLRQTLKPIDELKTLN